MLLLIYHYMLYESYCVTGHSSSGAKSLTQVPIAYVMAQFGGVYGNYLGHSVMDHANPKALIDTLLRDENFDKIVFDFLNHLVCVCALCTLN
jgi:hypothetical protein